MSQIARLLEIMARLRDPEDGCPWDLEQRFETISPHTIEEAYEVDDAIASENPEAIREELGDLLFQVVFQSRIAEEKGLFSFDGVVDAIAEKLVRRHPHIFADEDTPPTLAAQRATWEEIKAAERAAKGQPETGPPDPFEGIPRSLPALSRSAKVLGRLAGTGLAEPNLEGERARVQDAAALVASGPDAETVAAVLGDGLRAWVALARAVGVDPEQALRQADDRAIERAREHLRAAPNGADTP